MILISGALRIFFAKHLFKKRRRNGSQSYSNTSDLCWWQWESTLLETEGWVRMERASFSIKTHFSPPICHLTFCLLHTFRPYKPYIFYKAYYLMMTMTKTKKGTKISNVAFPPKCSLIFFTLFVPPTMFHKIFPPKICHQNFPQLFNILFCNFDPE